MNWDILFKGIGVIMAILIGLYQLRNGISKLRIQLKHDLEILKLLGPESEHYQLVKKSIDKDIIYIYKKSHNGFFSFDTYSKIDIIAGLIFIMTGILWTIFLLSKGIINLWIIVSIFLFIGGIGQLLAGLEARRRSK
jgi:hypothetical protein